MYILAEDKIYRVTNEYNDSFSISLENIEGDCYDVPSVLKKDVIKQSDKVEDLCDGFYIDWTSDIYSDTLTGIQKNIFVTYTWFLKAYKNLLENRKYNIKEVKTMEAYGFIKTSKGLKYVCKVQRYQPANDSIDWKLL